MPKILVIEDDAFNRQYIADILDDEGFEMDFAHDGKVGLSMLRTNAPDLILCDIMMPQMDGYELMGKLRQDKHTAPIPVILITALNDRKNVRVGMELGADDYLTKPFTPQELLAAIKTQLHKRDTIERNYETTLKLLRKNIIYALPHEIRTPMLKIMGYAQLMQMEAEQLTAEEIKHWSDTIISASERLNRMFENYIVYAQLEIVASDPQQREALRNHITAHPAEVITETAQEVAAAWQRDSDLYLHVANVAFRISRDDLKKITYEIVDNAFKFSKPGIPVSVSFVRDGNNVCLSVSDAGRGMDEEYIQLIGAYMQFERAIHEQQGLGLGMIIAKRLVELHAGEMIIDSAPDEGAHIHMVFPLF